MELDQTARDHVPGSSSVQFPPSGARIIDLISNREPMVAENVEKSTQV